jgi:hypothetical protein
MGVNIEKFIYPPNRQESLELLYTMFCDTYLANLNNFCAFGAVDNEGIVHALMSFYISDDEPSWFCTVSRSLGNNFLFKDILDEIMKYNENMGRLKFYSCMNIEQAPLMRRLSFSAEAKKRYDYFDEYIVDANHKSFYLSHWEILFKRSLIPVPTVIRCTFLKRKYRTILPKGGNI